MTKARRSSQRRSTARRSGSAIATPTRSAARGDTSADSIWDFDAPNFYDFANSKTPGRTADKWFDVAHPTPAIRQPRAPRLSTDSFLSTDSRDSLLPTRPSLSPSRIVAEKNGRLTIGDSQATSSNDADCNKQTAQDVEFSDTDDEIEFNNWKSAQALASNDNNDDDDEAHEGDDGSSGKCSEQPERSEESGGSTAAEHAGRASDEPKAAGTTAGRPQRVSAVKGGSRVAKKTVRAARSGSGPARSLTVPVASEFGFMRPTKGASQRLLAKKRDKANKRIIAEAICRTVGRRLSREASPKLTVPVPFQFHGSQGAQDSPPKAGAAGAAAPKLSRKAQEYLVAKLTVKRKATENGKDADHSSADARSNESPGKSTKKLRPTIPRTPQFAKSKRVRPELPEAAADDAAPRQATHEARGKLPQKPRLSLPKLTIPQPFVFHSDAGAEKSLQRLRGEMAKLRAEQEAMRQFRANPLPEFPTPKKPARHETTLHASPFSLVTDSRGEAYQRQLRARLEELEERRRERQRFTARPVPLSLDHPFVPQPSALPLTTVEEILLNTELRSEERRAFDEDRSERERIREEVLARKRLEEERREEEEIRQLRKALVHKAQPIRHFKPVDIKPSDRPLTVPKTPAWHVRTRRSVVAPTTPTD
ncbi:hypothetical protein LPJ61_003829 [Coemansia biformis]|uniref:TPX2 C-terminal domain-containing protein n=1 Tax=Coemansia biformis TaxID=1286918 RepID=A0A9W7Y5X2_9FUNG|nr:hypothetical protein LPJ61_003829 [Coemansia biformis]